MRKNRKEEQIDRITKELGSLARDGLIEHKGFEENEDVFR